MWTLLTIWKNFNTGETVKRETHTGFTSRLEAETKFSEAEKTGTTLPLGFITSPAGQVFSLDPHMYYMRAESFPL
jgi:hypothetical protein